MRKRVALLATTVLVVGCEGSGPGETGDVSSLSSLLGGEDGAGFEQVMAPRAFEFPRDWLAHPEYRTEWWYFTGNVQDAAGARWGFELALFRFGIADVGERASAWAGRGAWMAHLAVTDAQGRRFVAEESLAREALGLAGSEAQPARIWVGNWAVTGAPNSGPLKLMANGDRIGLELVVRTPAPWVPQGVNGVDAKGAGPGNASFYYSLPRVAVEGSLRLDDGTHAVQGSGWIDREWGTTTLDAKTVGWDWFGLQLMDGRSLMFYRLRYQDGTASPFSGGALVGRDGRRRPLGPEDVKLAVMRVWTSADSGASYPVAWRLDVPREGLVLGIEPLLEDQELALSMRYWEGAVDVAGTAAGVPIAGVGYIELTGY